jgi:triosephosphate isomerase
MASERRPLIAGNWKMNKLSTDGVALAQNVVAEAANYGHADLLICPPATLLSTLAGIVASTPVALGGQDCHAEPEGAHTGDISARMLRDAGCSHVIVGHSERRADHFEADETVRAKAAAAAGAGLTAIICVGETEAERDAGDTLMVVGRQIAGSVPDGATAANTVIAYEPVWAIGTGRTPTTDEVAEVHAAIRGEIARRFGTDVAAAMRILYGGSMKPANAAELLAIADVDGGLIGGASLVAKDFLAIAAAAGQG